MLHHRHFKLLAVGSVVSGVCVVAGCSQAADEEVGKSEHAESACGIGADPESTWDAVLDETQCVYKISGTDGIRNTGFCVGAGTRVAVYAISPSTGWCQTSFQNFEFIKCRVGGRKTMHFVKGPYQAELNQDLQLPGDKVAQVDRMVQAPLRDGTTRTALPIWDIQAAADGGDWYSFVQRGFTIPAGTRVGVYGIEGTVAQTSEWIQLFKLNSSPARDTNGSWLSIAQCGAGGQVLPELPESLKGCGFHQTASVIGFGEDQYNGHFTYESPNCGIYVDENYYGDNGSNMTMTLRTNGGSREVKIETVRRDQNGQHRWVPVQWIPVTGDAATTYSYAFGALEHAGWVENVESGDAAGCLGALSHLGGGAIAAFAECRSGEPLGCAGGLLEALSGLFDTSAECGR